MTRPQHPRTKPYAPRRAPPPILQRLDTRGFRGLEILNEHDEMPGFVLWSAFRDAELWTGAGAQAQLHRGSASWGEFITRLDASFAGIVPALRLLAGLSRLSRDEGAAIASGCDAIAEWSEQRSKLGTAVEFAQVASAAHPDHPMHAARAARLLKERAEWSRSVSWYDHAIHNARRVQDWYAYSDAYCGLASLHAERGNFPRARRLLQRALRAAQRHHVDEQVANAYHYLFTLECVAGNWERAELLVVKALAKYPNDSPKRARLARDLAYRWILRGYFDRALPLAQEVLRHFATPGLRALVWSDIARAAAGTGDEDVFERAWAQAKVLLDEGMSEPYGITILLNLAHGAAFRGEVARARLPAHAAAILARSRGEPQSVLEAEALLDSLPSAGVALPEKPPPRRAGHLVDEVLRILQEHRAVA
jgi:tetratricopeptide (TPR) repeat protein